MIFGCYCPDRAILVCPSPGPKDDRGSVEGVWSCWYWDWVEEGVRVCLMPAMRWNALIDWCQVTPIPAMPKPGNMNTTARRKTLTVGGATATPGLALLSGKGNPEIQSRQEWAIGVQVKFRVRTAKVSCARPITKTPIPVWPIL